MRPSAPSAYFRRTYQYSQQTGPRALAGLLISAMVIPLWLRWLLICLIGLVVFAQAELEGDARKDGWDMDDSMRSEMKGEFAQQEIQRMIDSAKRRPAEEVGQAIADNLALLVGFGTAGPRQEAEKARTRELMQRDHGDWSGTHPRHRILTALYGFWTYKDKSVKDLDGWKELYNQMPSAQRKFVNSVVPYESRFAKIHELFEENEQVLNDIIVHSLLHYDIELEELQEFGKQMRQSKKEPRDLNWKVAEALEHIVRDWSSDGEHERSVTFPQILRALKKIFPKRGEGHEKKVLLPGAGLGRLGYEISHLGGFEVTNNERSGFMNVCYRFLETLAFPKTNTIYPFIDNWSHHISAAEQQRGVQFPDVRVNTTQLVLREGDFLTEFNNSYNEYDAIVTLFFIDTAKNVIDYLETIKRLLKPGGVWINLGPLLYGNYAQLQPTLEDVVVLSEALGFEFLETEEKYGGPLTLQGRKVRGKEAGYTFNPRSLRKNAYSAQFWIARKKKEKEKR